MKVKSYQMLGLLVGHFVTGLQAEAIGALWKLWEGNRGWYDTLISAVGVAAENMTKKGDNNVYEYRFTTNLYGLNYGIVVIWPGPYCENLCSGDIEISIGPMGLSPNDFDSHEEYEVEYDRRHQESMAWLQDQLQAQITRDEAAA